MKPDVHPKVGAMSSDVKALVEEYRSLGWTVERSSKHWKFVPPGDGQIVYCSSTPSDPRSIKNTRALLRRSHATPSKQRYNQ